MAFVFLKKFNGFVLRAICHYKQMPLWAAFYHRKLALGANLRPLPQCFTRGALNLKPKFSYAKALQGLSKSAT